MQLAFLRTADHGKGQATDLGDMEMTGLNPDSDRVIEIATIVTSLDLDILAEARYRHTSK